MAARSFPALRPVLEDARPIASADPAGPGTWGTLLTCPGLHAVAAHRVAHRLWQVPRARTAARVLSAVSAQLTGSPSIPVR